MVREALGAIVPSAHGKDVMQSPLLDTKVRPGGVGSVSSTSFAADGPALLTTMVYDTVCPGSTLAGPLFVTARFAEAGRSDGSVASSFVGSGSTVPSGARTLAGFVTVPVASACTVAVAMNVAAPPAGRSTVVVIAPVPLGAPQLPPGVGVHDQLAPVSGGGNVS